MSRFPGKVDTDADLPRVFDNVTEDGAEAINAVREAVIAVETTLGVNPQGSQNTVVDRLNISLNANGTLKASAISGSGLVTLPVDNDDVASNAAIAESKLDLDVATQTLQNQIDSNNTDIDTLQSAVTDLTADFLGHTTGASAQHSAEDITMSPVLSGTVIDDVDAAVRHVWSEFVDHKAATSGSEHNASAIAYTPEVGSAISATNVQDALSEAADAYLDDRVLHNDSAHSDGVSSDGYYYLNGQGAVNSASLVPAKFAPPSGSNIVKIGLINSSVIRSSGCQPLNVSATAQNLDIAFITSGATRTLSIINLNSAAYPVAGRVTLEGIVDHINDKIADGYYPGTAFASDGEIVIQHNINRDDCKIRIVTPGSNSAVSALGFANVVDTDVDPVSNYIYVVDGNERFELETLTSDTGIVQAGLSSTVDLGQDVGSTGLNLRVGQLIHVFNHTNSSANGTYVIQTVSVSPATTISVNFNLTPGTFDYIIYEDTVELDGGSAKKTYDLFAKSDGTHESVLRANVTTSQIGGMALAAVSADFPTGNGTVSVSKSGTTYSVSCTIGGSTGITATFEEGYTGYLTVWAPDNREKLTYYISDLSPVSPATDNITFSTGSPADSKHLLGHVFHDGTALLHPVVVRNAGLVGISALGTEYSRGVVGRDFNLTRKAGFIRGFSTSIGSSTTTVDVQGGQAYVGGSYIQKGKVNINVFSEISGSGTWNLVLDQAANFYTFEDTGAYTVEGILANPHLLLVSQLVSDGYEVTDVTDLRFFINQLDDKVGLTVDDRDLGVGNFRTISAASTVSQFAPYDARQEITVLTDTTVTGDLDVNAESRLQSYGALTISGDVNIATGATVECWNDMSVGGTIDLATGASLIVHGALTAVDITMGDGTELGFDEDSTADSISVAGDNVRIFGGLTQPKITIASATTNGVTITDSSNVILQNFELEKEYSSGKLVYLTGTNSNILLDRVNIFQDQTLTTVDVSTAATRAGLYITGVTTDLVARDCSMSDLSAAVNVNGSLSNSLFSNCTIQHVGYGLYFDGSAPSTSVSYCDGYVTQFENSAFSFVNSTGDAVSDILICGNRIAENFTISLPSSSQKILHMTGSVDGLTFTRNNVGSLSSTVEYTTSGLIQLKGSGIIICDNYFHDITMKLTGNYGVLFVTADSDADHVSLISDNAFVACTGGLFRGARVIMTGNTANFTGSGLVSVRLIMLTSALDVTSVYGIISNNRFITTADQQIYLTNTVCTGNYFEVGSASVLNDETYGSNFRKTTLTDNTFVFTRDASALGMRIQNIASDQDNSMPIIVDGNHIIGSPATELVQIYSPSTTDIARVKFTNNSLQMRAPISGTILAIGASGDSATKPAGSYFEVTGNTIINDDAGTMSTGIKNRYMYTCIKDNFVSGNFSQHIVTDTYQTVITDNTCYDPAGGTELISNNTLNAPVIIARNKGVQDRVAFSSMQSFTDGYWVVDDADGRMIKNTQSGNYIWVPVSGLQEGVRIKQVEINLYASGSSGTVTAQLFQQKDINGAPFTNLAISSVASNGSAGSNNVITLTPTSTYHVKTNDVISVKISCSTANNKIGQVVAVIVY